MQIYRAFLVSVLAFVLNAEASAASVGVSTNWGLGYGHATQEFGTKEYKPQSVAGLVDLQVTFWKLILGGSYMNVTNLNLGEDRNYVGMGAVHVGLNLSNSVQIIGGVGAGKWRRRRENQLSTPSDYDYQASGSGYMAGIRLFLLNTKHFSVGLSGTFYQMKADKYEAVEDGVSSKVTADSKGIGQIGALVIRASLDDVQKLGKK